MKSSKRLVRATLGLLAAVTFGGCYTYDPAPKATMGESFTHREKDKSDKLLDGIDKLTLAQAQKIALKNNPSYISAHHAIKAAQFRYYQAMGAWLPTLNASFTLSDSNTWARGTHNMGASYEYPHHYSYTGTFGTKVGLSANWLIFDGLNREFGIMARKSSVKYYERMDADYCRKMMYAVAQAYNNVLLAIAQRRIAEENRKFQQISLKDTNYKFQAGAVPLSDVLNFEILMNSADGDLISADYTYDASLYALAVLMGYPEGTLPANVKFPIDLDLNFHELPAVEVYLDTALANRPDLKAYRNQLEAARYQLYQSYSAYSPTVSAFADLTFATSANRYRDWGYDRNHHSYVNTPSISYGLTVNWTLFNGFARYNTMREYQANVAVADYNVAAQWFTVVGEVRAAYANYVQMVRQTRLYEKNRELSKKQRDLVDEEYRAGNAELTRLNEAQRDLVKAETNLASSYIAIQNAKAQLDAAVGANTAEYYLNQNEDEVKGSPGLESLSADGQAAAKSSETPLAQPQKNDVIPGAESAAVTDKADKAAATPIPEDGKEHSETRETKSAAPAIPSDPSAPPAKKN